ncbi:unnamed protein product [Rhizophagus irregularis]|nr:unnamed protein product [Rhizophagus irregularis]
MISANNSFLVNYIFSIAGHNNMPSAYSEDLKWRIIYLHYDGYSEKQITKLLYISQSSVKRVLRLYRKWGTVTNPWKQIPGRHKTFNRNDMNILRSIVQKNVDWYLDEIVHEMEVQSGKHVSISTLWRSLVYCGIIRKKVFYFIL